MLIDISHELRTPLTAIQGALDILSCGKLGTLSQQEHRMVEIAVKNTERLIRLLAVIEAQPEAQSTLIYGERLTLLRLEQDLKTALINKELQIYYQPILNLQNQQVVGLEALLRWHHPSLGIISPTKFILLAEKSNLILDISKWVLQEVSHQIQVWLQQFPDQFENLTVSVNVSSKQLVEPDLVLQLKQILEATGINAKHIALEVTETALIEEEKTAHAILSQIQELGVKIYMDDFGTGYSSLNRIHQMPVNTIKIDRSFVQKLGSPIGKHIVETISKLATCLNLDIVAEGVETIEQINELRLLNCDRVQGYFFAEPLTADLVPNFVIYRS